jgi:hypothetical protein
MSRDGKRIALYFGKDDSIIIPDGVTSTMCHLKVA